MTSTTAAAAATAANGTAPQPYAITTHDRHGRTAERRAYTARSAASVAVSACLADDTHVRIRHDDQTADSPDLARLDPSGTLGMSVRVTVPPDHRSEHTTPGGARATLHRALQAGANPANATA